MRPAVDAIETGWRFLVGHGATVRRARALCATADLLEVRRPPDWQGRAERLYRRAARDLADVVPLAAFEMPELVPAPRARRLLRSAAAPTRRLLLAVGALVAALAAVVALAVLLACWLSPAVRARLFPGDLAARSSWVASSAVPPNPISGVGPASRRHPLFFHTQSSDHPWIEIDLGAPRTIRSLLIENRRDCCEQRALPLNVEVFDEASAQWRVVAQRRSAFIVWTRDLTPVRARRVRVRLAGVGILHLKRISLYEW